MPLVRKSVRPELRVAAYGVCVQDGMVLLAHFVGPRGDRHWTLPGGGLEHAEDPYHAVVREVAEETGYDVEVERLLGVHSARYSYPRGLTAVADHHAVRIIYGVRIVGGSLRPEVGGSTDQAAWTPLDRLDELAAVRNEMVDVALRLHHERPPTGHADPV